MPIGLPDITRKGGRGPETLVRPLLGATPVERLFDPVARRRLRGSRGVHDARALVRGASQGKRGGAHDVGAAARRVDPGFRDFLQDPRDRRAAAGATRAWTARHRIAPGSGLLATQRRASDAAAQEGEGPDQPAWDGRAPRAAVRPRLGARFPGAMRRRAERQPTISSTHAPCCSSRRAMRAAKRGPFRTRRASTARHSHRDLGVNARASFAQCARNCRGGRSNVDRGRRLL